MTGLSEAMILMAKHDADVSSLKRGVNAGIIRTPDEAVTMYPDLEKEMISEIFRSSEDDSEG